MEIRIEEREKFLVCGPQDFIPKESTEKIKEIRDRFWGKDQGERFEALIGCEQGYYGVFSEKEKPRRSKNNPEGNLPESPEITENGLLATYLFGKETLPTAYLPAGSVQIKVEEDSYVVASFHNATSEKEDYSDNLTPEEAWKFFLNIFIPKSKYKIKDGGIGRFEYFPRKDKDDFELWVPILP